MPLKHGYSPRSIAANIRAERKAGRPRRQAIAIALGTAREARRESGTARRSSRRGR